MKPFTEAERNFLAITIDCVLTTGMVELPENVILLQSVRKKLSER